MKPVNLRLQLPPYGMLSVVLIFLLAFVFNACKKADAPLVKDDVFDAKAAKEWYYGTFKRSAEWASSALHGKKLPDWEHGLYKKIGNMEIVEFPLVMTKKTVLIPSTEGFNLADKKRITASSLAKIAFIQKANKKIVVRETDFVPDFLFLQNNHYDISHASLLKADNDFSGQIIIRNWKDEIVSMKRMQEGKITGNIKKRVDVAASINNAKSRFGSSGDCEPLFDCIFVEVCDETIYPDKLVTYTNCELINTGDCVPLDNCPLDPCVGLSSEECACELYGDCGDDGGDGGDGEEENCAIKENEMTVALSYGSAPTGEGEIAVCSPGSVRRTKCYNWTVYKFSSGVFLPCVVKSKEKGVQVLGSDNKWRFESFTHENMSIVGTTILYSLEIQQPSSQPTILPDAQGVTNQFGNMYVNCTLKCSAVCRGFPYSKNTDVSNSNQWNVNE